MDRYLLLFAAIISFARAYPTFQDEIPNGELVPHPCKPNYLWKGVGHFNVLGGGPRNPFGLDFHRLGKMWSRELCQLDSDGDGKTNGEELGDPDCNWSKYGDPPSKSATGHPGVCEPVDSLLCRAKNAAAKEDWEFCEQGEFICDAISEPEVKNFTIAIGTGTQVPAKETTYMCQLVKLPDHVSERKYHIIGNKPQIDNKIVAHHIIIYGCGDEVLEKLSHYSTPQPCNSMLIQSSCKYGVAGWTVGQSGNCDLPHVGTPMGRRMYNYALIEIHWNNPMEVPDYTDGSGITIFYTPKLRKYDAGVLTLGQLSLAIPPNVENHYQTGYCRSQCTRHLKQPINLYSVNFHMHYLGRGGRVELWRNGSLHQVLAEVESYSYDNPLDYALDPPVALEANDELKSFCKFKSRTTNEVTYYGEGTGDEMCFIFVSYYPDISFGDCMNYGPVSTCSLGDSDSFLYENVMKLGCDMNEFEEIITEIGAEAGRICGYTATTCSPACQKYFEKVYREEPCLNYDLRFMFEMFMRTFASDDTESFINFLRICDRDIVKANAVTNYFEEVDRLLTAGANSLRSFGAFAMSFATMLLIFKQY